MKKPPVADKNSKPPLAVPAFHSEAEEAAWWDANEDHMFDRARQFGHLAPPLKVVRTRPVSLRIDQDVLDKAKEIAKAKHLPYQRVLPEAMRAGLDKVASA